MRLKIPSALVLIFLVGAGLFTLEAASFERDVLPILQRSCFECHSSAVERPKGGLRLDTRTAIEEAARNGLYVRGRADGNEFVRVLLLPKGDEELMPPNGKAPEVNRREAMKIRDWIKQGADFGNWTGVEALSHEAVQATGHFGEKVLPVLAAKCFDCHSSRTSKPKGGLRYDTAEGLRALQRSPGLARLLEVVSLPESAEDHMPPRGKSESLSKEEIADLKSWIAEGATVGRWRQFDHRSAVKLVSGLGKRTLATDVPVAAREIDRIVAAGLERRGRKRNAEVDDVAFLRRVYLELIGRIPTAQEAEHFLTTSEPRKRAGLIDRLSASNGYVSRHFNYWADVLRAQSEQEGNRDNTYLAYLKRTIAANKPYDDWVRELVMAEGRMWSDPQIGFYLRDSKNRLAGYEALTAVFLGTEIGCAQCHDHPMEPVSQLDYFKMWGFLKMSHPYGGKDDAFTKLNFKEVEASRHQMRHENKIKRIGHSSREKDIETTSYLVNSKMLSESITVQDMTRMSRVPDTYRYDDRKHNDYLHPGTIFGESPDLPKSGVKPSHVFAEWMTSPDNLKFTHTIANRIWAKVMGAPLLASLTHITAPDESPHRQLADHLAELMIACDYDLKLFQRILLNTRTYQSQSVAADQLGTDFAFRGPVLRRLNAEQVWDSLITLIVPDPDASIDVSTPDLSFYNSLRNVESIEDYWKMIGRYVDERRAKNGTGGSMYGRGRITGRKVASIGFDPDALHRASELPSPAEPGHFLRVFGQASRDQVENSWSTPTIPQSLMLMNGGLHDRMAESDSPISRTIAAAGNPERKIRMIFLSVLGRLPDADDRKLAYKVVGHAQTPDWNRLVWALINTTEFVFQQ